MNVGERWPGRRLARRSFGDGGGFLPGDHRISPAADLLQRSAKVIQDLSEHGSIEREHLVRLRQRADRCGGKLELGRRSSGRGAPDICRTNGDELGRRGPDDQCRW